jgi:hypothetical protein
METNTSPNSATSNGTNHSQDSGAPKTTMDTNTSSALQNFGVLNGTTNSVSDLDLNLYRITKALECLAWYLESGNQINDSSIFCRLCISLSRGIDYAIAYGQTPSPKAIQLLHMVMKKIDYQIKSEGECFERM